MLIEDLAKAELLAEFYVTVIGVDNRIANEDQLKLYFEECLQEESEDYINEDFRSNEMQVQIQNLKTKKAFGVDEIANKLIIHLSEEFLFCILELYNIIWTEVDGPL